MTIIFHLFLTIALELLIYGLGDRFKLKSVIAMTIANLLLNLTMNLVAVSFESYDSYFYFILGAEIFTFVTEAFVYFLFTNKKLWYCFVISFAANILSLATGNIFNRTGLIYKNGVVNTITVIWIVLMLLQISFAYALWLRAYMKKLYNEKP